MNKVVLKLPNVVWIINLLCFFGLLFNSCITFTPPQSQTHQKFQSHNSNTRTSTDTSQTIPVTQSAKSTNVAYQHVLMSNHVRTIAADERNVWIGTDRGVSRLNRLTERWTHYTVADGLASDLINDILIDADSVWFATERGVSRFRYASGFDTLRTQPSASTQGLDLNAGTWRNFDSRNGLVGDNVACIALDGDYIWFGTDRGLNRYDKRIDNWAARTKEDGLSSNNITAIAVTDNYIWIGSKAEKRLPGMSRGRRRRLSRGGVDRYHKSTDSWNKYSKSDGLADNEISTIAIDEDTVWFGTFTNGISIYSQTDQSFVKSYTKSDFLSSDDITDITMDGNYIWIATANEGVQRHIKSVNTWMKYTTKDGLASDHINCLTVFKNEVWLGTYDSGVTLYDKVKNRWTIFQRLNFLPSNEVNMVYQSKNGKVWAATTGGLGVFQDGNWYRYGKQSGLASNFVTAVFQDGDDLWVGTFHGFGKLNRSVGRWQFFLTNGNIKDKFITAIHIEGDNGWLGTRSGAYSFNPFSPEESLQPIPELEGLRINQIISTEGKVTKKGVLFATSSGLWRISSKPKRLLNKYINSTLVTDKLLLTGTRGGLSVYDSQLDKWRTYTRDNGLTSENVTALTYDKKRGLVWLGTTSGIFVLDVQSRSLSDFGYDSQLGRCNVKSVYVRDDTLWVGTSNGLVKVNLETETVSKFSASPKRDILKIPSVASVVFDGDDVWFSNWYQTSDGAIFRMNRKTLAWRRYSREIILGSDKVTYISRIYRIVPDKNHVWFTTDDGVLQYDKVKDIWHHYTVKDGLANNYPYEIAISETSVWIIFRRGTEVSRYDKNTGKWKTIDLPENTDLPFEDIEAVATDGDDVWFASDYSGIRRYNEKTAADEKKGEWKVYNTKDGLANDRVEQLAVDGDYLWIAYRGGSIGLSRYDKIKGTFQHYNAASVLADERISKIYVGKDNVWFLYRNWRSAGVTKYDKRNDEWITIKPKGERRSEVVDIAEDGDYLWLATSREGLKRYHIASGTWTDFTTIEGLADDRIFEYSLKVDDRYVFVGTEGGFSIFDKKSEKWVSYTVQNYLADKEVVALAAGERYLWVGTKSGLSKYDKKYDEWETYQREYGWWLETEVGHDYLVDNSISCLAVDESNLWIGTREGANKYDQLADRWFVFSDRNGLPSEDITAVAIDEYDIWMGTNAGLSKYPKMSDNKNAWVTYTSAIDIKPTMTSKQFANTLVSNEVWCISVDEDYVWIGTQRGVSRCDKEKDLWRTFTQEDGLASNAVTSIAIWGDEVWFGTSKGVTVYNKETKDWITYTQEDGLASNDVTCIASDEEYIWIGTVNSGISRYEPKTKTWKRITKKNGLVRDSILSITVDGDFVWVGTQNGLSRYDKKTDSWTPYVVN